METWFVFSYFRWKQNYDKFRNESTLYNQDNINYEINKGTFSIRHIISHLQGIILLITGYENC